MKLFSKFTVSLVTVISFFTAGSFVLYSAQEENIKFEKKSIGTVLVDGKGMTLYYFKKDLKGKSNCTGDCLTKWPAFHVDKVMPGKGLKEADFGMITRDDGKVQTTYRGFPLYYYFMDNKPGDLKGQKVKDVWFVITPAFK